MTRSSPYGCGPEFSEPLRWRLQDLRDRLRRRFRGSPTTEPAVYPIPDTSGERPGSATGHPIRARTR